MYNSILYKEKEIIFFFYLQYTSMSDGDSFSNIGTNVSIGSNLVVPNIKATSTTVSNLLSSNATLIKKCYIKS